MARKDSMQRQHGASSQVEQRLWHGTSSDTLESIKLTGFNRSYCGKNGMGQLHIFDAVVQNLFLMLLFRTYFCANCYHSLGFSYLFQMALDHWHCADSINYFGLITACFRIAVASFWRLFFSGRPTE